jgi:site-specific DNA recombinase
MSNHATRRVVIYARLSVTTEESVSIERQLSSARKYCESREWVVVQEFVDDGVSASKVKPEDRKGWRALVGSPLEYDAVLVWKVDRLARRVLDFLHADETLQQRGAGIVAVEDPVDMTTPQGRAFATMLAVFAEMEAAAISARVKAARAALLSMGRRAGGRPPYGWQNVPGPGGKGYVLGIDPDRFPYVEDLVWKALRGDSLYSLTRLMDEIGDRADRKGDTWHEASVEAILRNPVVAGLVPFQPGRKPGAEADPWAVLRDEDGQMVRDESVAILEVEQRRQLLAVLDAAKKPGTRADRADPALLTGLLHCASCGRTMHRATAATSRYLVYRCPGVKSATGLRHCPAPVSVGRERVEGVVVERLLAEVGNDPHVTIHESYSASGAAAVEQLEATIRETTALMADADEDAMPGLVTKLKQLKEARQEARETPAGERQVIYTGQTFAERWEAAGDDMEAQRQLLRDAFTGVRIKSGKGGRYFDRERVEIDWVKWKDRHLIEVETTVA